MVKYVKADSFTTKGLTTQELAAEPEVEEYLDNLHYNYIDEYETQNDAEIAFYVDTSRRIDNNLYELTIQADIGYEDQSYGWVDDSFSFKVSYNVKTGELDSDYED